VEKTKKKKNKAKRRLVGAAKRLFNVLQATKAPEVDAVAIKQSV
jgi:hypothetical protein